VSLLPRLVAAVRRGPLPLLRGGVAAIDLTHVSDVIRAIEAALVADPEVDGQAINVSGGEQIEIRRIVEAVTARVGGEVRWRSVPLAPVMVAASALERASLTLPWLGEPRITRYAIGLFAFRQSLDLRKARDLMGWSPQVRFAQGLDLTFGAGAK
jgi:nucleoside-diphosphate-sugar epimerase